MKTLIKIKTLYYSAGPGGSSKKGRNRTRSAFRKSSRNFRRDYFVNEGPRGNSGWIIRLCVENSKGLCHVNFN